MIQLKTIKQTVLTYFDDQQLSWELLDESNQLHRLVIDDIYIILGIEDNQHKLVIVDNIYHCQMYINNKHDVNTLIISYLYEKFNDL